MDPSRSSSVKSSSAALASLPPLAGTAPSVMRTWRPQAVTIMRGACCRPVSKAPRIDLPSIAICRLWPVAAATRRNRLTSASANAFASSLRNRPENVSWEGMPCSRRKMSPSNAAFSWPNRSMSEQFLAPHKVAARAMNITSQKSCRAFWRLGSRSAKVAMNVCIENSPFEESS